MDIQIRRATNSDLSEILDVFVSTIDSISSYDYNEEQRRVWKDSSQDEESWKMKIKTQYFLIAESNKIRGFASLEKADHIDLMYVHKEYQRRAIGQLLTDLEAKALHEGVRNVSVDASINALPFFERSGFKIIRKQTKCIDSVEIVNFRMEKELSIRI